jgi:hypothetical protein
LNAESSLGGLRIKRGGDLWGQSGGRIVHYFRLGQKTSKVLGNDKNAWSLVRVRGLHGVPFGLGLTVLFLIRGDYRAWPPKFGQGGPCGLDGRGDL